MKNPELFHKTVGILVKSYFDETLEHSICGCAVGNLICANMGIDIRCFHPSWNSVFVTTTMCGSEFHINKYRGNAKKQIDSTGYSPYELALIEKAFESGRLNNDMFSDLMSVVNALSEIHEATETEAKQAKELFTLTA